MSGRRTKTALRTTTEPASIAPARQQTPAVPDVWDVFARQLQQCVDDLDTDDILILERKGVNQYVQVLHWGFAICAEAASNAYILPPSALLDERQYARAKLLGWTPPTVTPETAQELEGLEEPYEGSPNFHRLFELGEAGLVELLINTFRQVYGVHSPSRLQYKSFTADGRQQIRWTGLSIKRVML